MISPTTVKCSISLPSDLYYFLEGYQEANNISRSEAIALSIKSFRELKLQQAYKEHAIEWENDPESCFWDTAAIDDGINVEECDFSNTVV